MGDILEHDELYERPHEFLHPRTPRQLAEARARSMAQQGGPPEDSFTCDDCSFVPYCKLAFDWYNTNGDCLAEK